MLSTETLQAEANELRDQLGKAQQQLYAGKQQVKSISATVERLRGAIIMVEKFLSQTGGAPAPPQPTPNGQMAVPAA